MTSSVHSCAMAHSGAWTIPSLNRPCPVLSSTRRHAAEVIVDLGGVSNQSRGGRILLNKGVQKHQKRVHGGGTVARGCPPEVGDRGNLGARGRRGPRADSPGFNSSVERARTHVDGCCRWRARISDGRKIVRRHARFMLRPAPRPHRGPGDVRTSLRRAVWLELSGVLTTSQHRGGAKNEQS